MIAAQEWKAEISIGHFVEHLVCMVNSLFWRAKRLVLCLWVGIEAMPLEFGEGHCHNLIINFEQLGLRTNVSKDLLYQGKKSTKEGLFSFSSSKPVVQSPTAFVGSAIKSPPFGIKDLAMLPQMFLRCFLCLR
ncbi:hypothetical protein ACLB2K_071896 [Fragaria x ananassa]